MGAQRGSASDRVPPQQQIWRRAVPPAHPAGTAGAAPGPAAGRRSAAHRQRGGRLAGDQPQHRAQGLPGTGVRGPRRGQARRRHVRDQDPQRRVGRRAPGAEPGAVGVDPPRPAGGPGLREHRGAVSAGRPVRGTGGSSMTNATAAIEARGLGRRYGHRWALADCTLTIPAGHVAGLVGPNGAGKTTLISLATGMLAPTAGTIQVLGGLPASDPGQLARVGYVAQDTPTYAGLSVADHLRLGAHLNPRWDAGLARRRIEQLGMDPRQKAGRLSGGQRAQLALTLALAKRPELLILDEPIASLDPVARREFLQVLMQVTAEQELSVVMSSHLVADLERVADYLVVLVDSRVRITGEVDDLLATHHLLTGPRRPAATLPAGQEIITDSHAGRQSTFLVRSSEPVIDPAWTVEPVSLEDLVLAYMGHASGSPQEQRLEVHQ